MENEEKYVFQTLIVSRHHATINELKKIVPEAIVKEQFEKDDWYRSIVYGTLPVHLAHKCYQYFHVELNVPREFRGTEFSEEQLKNFGFNVQEYFVKKL